MTFFRKALLVAALALAISVLLAPTAQGQTGTHPPQTFGSLPGEHGTGVAITAQTPSGSSYDWTLAVAVAAGLMLVLLVAGITGSSRWGSTTTKRRRLARWLERSAVPERPFIGRGPRYLVRPSVATACAPSLRAMAAALRDEMVVVDSDQLQALQSFISDGQSVFFGDDPTAALRESVRLQHSVVGAEPAALELEQAVAA